MKYQAERLLLLRCLREPPLQPCEFLHFLHAGNFSDEIARRVQAADFVTTRNFLQLVC